MGQGNSSQGTSSQGQTSYPAYSYVNLEEDRIFSGSIITGNVNIQVEQPISVSDISIVIKGKELTYWQEKVAHRRYTGGKSRVYYTMETRAGLNVIFAHSVPLLSLNGTLMAGQYSIPFSIKMPDAIKHSVRFIAEKFKGRRYYTIKAKVPEGRQLKSIRNFFWVSKTANQKQLLPVSCTDNFDVKTCCCFGKDKAVVNLSIDKEAYYITDKINGVFKNDNTHSKKSFEKFTIQLVRTIRLKDNVGHTQLINHFLVTEDVKIDVLSSTGPITSHSFVIDLAQVKTLCMIPSTDSGMVECVYNVKITPTYDACCSGMDYPIAVYIDVCNSTGNTHAAEVEQITPVVASWNPVVLTPQPNFYLQPVQYNQIQYYQDQQYTQSGQYAMPQSGAQPDQYTMPIQYIQPQQYAMNQQVIHPEKHTMVQQYTQPGQYDMTQQVAKPEQDTMAQPVPQANKTEHPQ